MIAVVSHAAEAFGWVLTAIGALLAIALGLYTWARRRPLQDDDGSAMLVAVMLVALVFALVFIMVGAKT